MGVGQRMTKLGSDTPTGSRYATARVSGQSAWVSVSIKQRFRENRVRFGVGAGFGVGLLEVGVGGRGWGCP